MSPDGTIAAHFAELTDPRIARCKRHDLLAIVTIALCGVTCRADPWVAIAGLLVRSFSSPPARSATATHTMSTVSDRSHDERVSALPAAIAHTGPMISEAVRIPATDTTVDQIAADPEQNLPYLAEIWPSGIDLAGAIEAPPEPASQRQKWTL